MNSYQTEHFSTDSLMNKTTEKIPTWSLGYIINGDMTGLTDEEIRMMHSPISRLIPFSDFLPKWRTATYFTRMTTSKI